MKTEKWVKYAAVTICAAGVFLVLFLFGKYLLPALLPFAFAFLTAVLLRPAVLFLEKKAHWPFSYCSVFVTTVFLLLFAGLCFFLCSRLFEEAQNLFSSLLSDLSNENGMISSFLAFWKDLGRRLNFHLSERFPAIRDLIGDPSAFISETLRGLLSGITAALPPFLLSLLRSLPSFLFSFLIYLIATYYFSLDFSLVRETLLQCLPSALRQKWPGMRERVFGVCRRYLRAYFFIFLLTFGELLLGFLSLRLNYAFLLALVTALLDILPVLGVGLVLLPFGIFELCTGQVLRGVGLLLLYAVITVVRQVVEPRWVGKSLGVHPLLLLFGIYAGLRIFGVAGLLVGPLAALLMRALFLLRRKKENRAQD